MKNLLALKIIKLCLKREFYQRYSKKISKESLANINDIYKTIGRIYDELESCKEILPDDLHIHHLTYNPTLTESKKEKSEQLSKDLKEVEINEDSVVHTIEQLHISQTAHKASQELLKVYEGRSKDIKSIIKILEEENTIGDSVVEVTKDLDELLQEMDYSKLFSFNSPSALNSYVKGVGKGHFTIIFARPS